MRRSEVIDNARIQAGDLIVDLHPSGRPLTKREYNGGMGSNGLTSARHDVLSKKNMQALSLRASILLSREILFIQAKKALEILLKSME